MHKASDTQRNSSPPRTRWLPLKLNILPPATSPHPVHTGRDISGIANISPAGAVWLSCPWSLPACGENRLYPSQTPDILKASPRVSMPSSLPESRGRHALERLRMANSGSYLHYHFRVAFHLLSIFLERLEMAFEQSAFFFLNQKIKQQEYSWLKSKLKEVN